MKNYTLIDPEENSNMDYQLSQTKYDKLSAYEQSLYEEAESEDDIDEEED